MAPAPVTLPKLKRIAGRCRINPTSEEVTRDWEMPPHWRGVRIALGLLVALGLVLALAQPFGCDDRGREKRNFVTCMNGMMHLGGLLRARRERGDLCAMAGEAFLLQLADEMKDAHLRFFLCWGEPGNDCFHRYRDPEPVSREGLRSSYLGPDLETAGRFVRGELDVKVFIACDAPGADGEPHHRHGLTVLRADGLADFVEWKVMQGYDGGPVPVGPDSPDPRFRHLVK